MSHKQQQHRIVAGKDHMMPLTLTPRSSVQHSVANILHVMCIVKRSVSVHKLRCLSSPAGAADSDSMSGLCSYSNILHVTCIV